MTSVSTDRRQGINSGSAIKVPVRAATTANITLTGLQTIDGVVLAADDRVLVKNQTTGAENGIYTADTGNWTRSEDFDGTYDVVCGSLVYVTAGTVSAGKVYGVTTADPITIDTTALVFAQAGLLYSPVQLPDGTVGAPSVSWASEPTSGLYRIGALTVGYSILGTKIVQISNTGMSITGALATTGAINATGQLTAGGQVAFTAAGNALAFTGQTTGPQYMTMANTSGAMTFGIEGSAGAVLAAGSSAYATVLSTSAAKSLQFGANNTIVQTIGSTGVTVFTCPTSGSTIMNLSQTHASAPFGLAIGFTADPNGTSNYFLQCTGNGTERATIRSNGGLANFSGNNANLSDERLKKDIADAPSYYEVFKALRVRTFKYKDQTDDIPTLGVIAQELEAIAPELIDAEGWSAKEIPLVVDGKVVEQEHLALDENKEQLYDIERTDLVDANGEQLVRRVPRVELRPVMVENPNFAPGGVPLKAIYQTDFQFATARALQETIVALEQLRADFAAYKSSHP